MTSLRPVDKKIFEYIHHLYYENKTSKDLSWQDHQDSDWIFHSKLTKYYNLCFKNVQEYIKNCTILDIGCNIGSKISWFENLGASSYIGIDPDPKCVELAKTVTNIINMECSIYQTTAEESQIIADTSFLLSVSHKFKNQQVVLENLCSQNFVMETWIEKIGCFSEQYYVDLLSKKYKITYKTFLQSDKLVIAGTRLDNV